MTELAGALRALPLRDLLARSEGATAAEVRAALRRERRDLRDLAALLSPAAAELLEETARASAALTARRFGRTILLYAPLYLSNECVNVCTYCGFRADLDVKRSTLSPGEIDEGLGFLARLGFRHVLLVTGEHPKKIPLDYLEDGVRRARRRFPSVSIEVEPLDSAGYGRIVAAGADGVTLYQETYDRDRYGEYHPRGPKSDYDNRLEALSRAAEAGIRRVNLGALLGLAPWREEMFRLALHASYLTRRYWKTHVSISFPRIREAAGHFVPPFPVGDRELTQMLAALRLFLPDAGLVVSTRERPRLRDGLARIGATQMSAGSRTEPGGYLHPDEAEGQFEVDDSRSPAEVADRLRELGLDPVWKDWEEALHG
ncbi:MAG: 2-iminoacetate synthase ThiH [Candidatus Eisenbacteria bacterium]|nr:2-iminoacetate synthase ThiH [Candidatus Eisenbacteria bacterium]